MATELSDKDIVNREIERLKKRINNLNIAISLQANKIGNTNTVVIISREEKILNDRIRRKKLALETLELLRKKMLNFQR